MNSNTIDYKILDKRLGTSFSMPKFASSGSAGIDLVACIDSDLIIKPGDVSLISTGLAIYIKDPLVAGLIMPRSGLGHKHGLILGNGIGLIDSDYQGEIKVSCWNRSSEQFVLTPGLRLAQLVFVSIKIPVFNEVESFTTTVRGEGGFGSTGTHEHTA